MQHITKLKLAAVHQLCDAEDMSTEYMLQVMQDTCDVDMDCCIAYMALPSEEHTTLFKEVMAVVEVITKLDSASIN